MKVNAHNFSSDKGQSPATAELFVRLHYRLTSAVCDPREQDENYFITAITGDIRGSNADTAATVKLGALKMFLIRMERILESKVGVLTAMDYYQQTCEASEVLFNRACSDFHPDIEKNFEEAYFHEDILLIDRLTFYPLARGQGLGLAVLHQAISDWSNGCSLAVIKPYPLQFEADRDKDGDETELQLEDFKFPQREAFRRLRAYYQRLGFTRIGKTKYYALSLKLQNPSWEDLSLSSSIVISK